MRVGGLESVTTALAAASTPDEVADAVLVEGLAAVGADAAVVCRLGDDRALEIVASKGYPAAALGVLVSAPVTDLGVPLAIAVRTGDAVLLERDDAGGAVAALPLRHGIEVIGGLAFRFGAARTFTSDDRESLVVIAGATAYALHRGALAERVGVLAAVLDTAPVGLGVVDERLRFEVANHHLERLVHGNQDGDGDGDGDGDTNPARDALVDIARSVLDTDAAVVGAEPADLGVVVSAYPLTVGIGTRRVGVVVTPVAAERESETRLREESQVVETLHFVGRQLAGELDPSRVVDVVTQAAAMVTDADAAVYLAPVDDAGSAGSAGIVPVVLASVGDAAPFLAAFDVDLAARTLRDGEVVRLDDAGGRGGATSYLAVPVTARGGRSVGALFLVHGAAAAFDERDARLVVGIAGQAGVALDDAELYQAERRAREQLAVLAEAGRVLASSMDVDALVAEVARLVVPALADACMIDLTREDGTVRRVASTAGDDDELVRALEAHAPAPDDVARPVLRRIRTSREVELVPIDEAFVSQAWPDDVAYQRLLRDRVHVGAVVPMASRDTVVGRLTLLMGASGRDFRADDAPMLLDLGRRIAVAVENARLFAHQRSVAISLQQSLLPDRLPNIANVSMAARYLPGGPDVDVGGDWYDVLAMPNGTLGFAMGDVVGRGVRAAALMGQLRSALRGYALEGHHPGRCLEHLDVLLDVITGGALVTAVKGHLYPDERRAVLANAGHLPPLLLHPDGSVEFVAEALGVPLSTLDVPRYDDIWLEFPPGTAIVLYTDGLVEERDSSLEVGLARLADACRAGPRHDLQALCDHVLASLLAGRSARDDVALLVVRLDA